MTSDQEKDRCLFRQINEMFNKAELPASDIEPALNQPDVFGCEVGRCAIMGKDIFAFAFGGGRHDIRAELDALVAPSCSLNDVVQPWESDQANFPLPEHPSEGDIDE